QSDVMGVASTDDLDQRSTFSNFGDGIVCVAAPGEAIITTYPFGTYGAAWGTSFSAPFVAGAVDLLLDQRPSTNESQAAAAVAHAVPIGPNMGNGRLDLAQALAANAALGAAFYLAESDHRAAGSIGALDPRGPSSWWRVELTVRSVDESFAVLHFLHELPLNRPLGTAQSLLFSCRRKRRARRAWHKNNTAW